MNDKSYKMSEDLEEVLTDRACEIAAVYAKLYYLSYPMFKIKEVKFTWCRCRWIARIACESHAKRKYFVTRSIIMHQL